MGLWKLRAAVLVSGLWALGCAGGEEQVEEPVDEVEEPEPEEEAMDPLEAFMGEWKLRPSPATVRMYKIQYAAITGNKKKLKKLAPLEEWEQDLYDRTVEKKRSDPKYIEILERIIVNTKDRKWVVSRGQVVDQVGDSRFEKTFKVLSKGEQSMKIEVSSTYSETVYELNFTDDWKKAELKDVDHGLVVTLVRTGR